MLNKRVKSLLIAGLLVFSMSGTAFAGNGNDGCQAPGLRGEHNGNSHHVTNITEESWDAYVAEFNRVNAGKFEIVSSGGKYKVMNLETNKQIEIIHVEFNKELTKEEEAEKGQDPVDPVPPVYPELPEEEPPTGDAGIISMVSIAAVSAVGLFALRKKDDEE